jgi:hypothetical protein
VSLSLLRASFLEQLLNGVGEWWSGVAVTQHTTACCSMQVVDITLAEQVSTNIASLRMVQQKHCGPNYKLIHIILQTKA